MPPSVLGSGLDRRSLLDLLVRTFAPGAAELAFPVVAACLRPPAQAFVFGGVLRNVVLARVLQKRFSIRDVDYVVFGVATDDELYDAFAGRHPRRNRFGGLKIDIGSVTVDLAVRARTSHRRAATASGQTRGFPALRDAND